MLFRQKCGVQGVAINVQCTHKQLTICAGLMAGAEVKSREFNLWIMCVELILTLLCCFSYFRLPLLVWFSFHDRLSLCIRCFRRFLPYFTAQADPGGAAGASWLNAEWWQKNTDERRVWADLPAKQPTNSLAEGSRGPFRSCTVLSSAIRFFSKHMGRCHAAVTLTKTDRLCVDRYLYTWVLNGCYGNPLPDSTGAEEYGKCQTDRTLMAVGNAERESCDLLLSVTTVLLMNFFSFSKTEAPGISTMTYSCWNLAVKLIIFPAVMCFLVLMSSAHHSMSVFPPSLPTPFVPLLLLCDEPIKDTQQKKAVRLFYRSRRRERPKETTGRLISSSNARWNAWSCGKIVLFQQNMNCAKRMDGSAGHVMVHMMRMWKWIFHSIQRTN